MTSMSSTRSYSVALALWPLVAAVCLLAALVWTGSLSSVMPMLNIIASAASEPNFYGSALAGLGLLAGGAVAHCLQTKKRSWQGFAQACGSGLWVPMLASALLGVAISNLAWGWTLADDSWQPLFVPFVSVSPTIVLMFGADVKTVLTGGVLGGLITPPLSIFGADVICPWVGVPPVVGITGGMAVGALIAFMICRHLPWLPVPLHLQRRAEAPTPAPAQKRGPTWLLRRGVADFSEAQFFGSEWAGFGLILGVVVGYLLNPALPAYGSGLLPQILAAQVLTAIIAVTLWRGQWARRPFYPTFVPVVSIAPACVLAYGGTATSIIAGAVLGAVFSPPLAAAISSRLPTDFHPFIGNVAAMAIATSLIVTPLQLLPGI
jgi:MFS transporter, ENTS family, enterobactin (siderophore) exporter